MSEEIIVITGAGSGIGQALAWHFAGRGQIVLGLGRRLCALEKTRQKDETKIHILTTDISREQDRRKVAEWFFGNDYTVKYLIHNAAVLEPVERLVNIALRQWREHMAVNVEGPLFLTQALLPFMKGGRILHISSGAAHKPYPGWGAYCTSKAALHMLYQLLREELRQKHIVVGSARPGVVDTPMQDRVREADKDVFPALDRFVALKEEQKLYSPQHVAAFLAHLLTETTDSEFSQKEWDIRESAF